MTLRVLYGVQGTGNGHLARARCMVPALRAAGIELKFLMSGRDEGQFFNMEMFPGYEHRAGLTMTIEGGKVLPIRTVLDNQFWRFFRDVIALDLSDIDLVINDFEPVTAWAAKLRGVPSISISHQSAFDHAVPKVKGHILSRLIMRLFAPTRESLGVHWHHFGQQVLPPIIERHKVVETDPKLILVYMAFESLDEVLSFLSPFSEYRFEVFAKVKQVIHQDNITVNPLSHDEFHRQLERCSGVICNTGFELSSEALQLGKKLLTKPLDGQYEQLCNALGLQTLSRATVMTTLDKDMLSEWLTLRGHDPIDYPDVADAVANWLVQSPRQDSKNLVSSLWACFDNPCQYKEEFGPSLRENLLY
jgi:uncharacterized protein (TIGR00661 family)